MSDELTPTFSKPVRVYGRNECGRAYAIRDLLHRADVPFEWTEVTTDEICCQLGVTGPRDSCLPLCIFPDGTRLDRPTNRQILEKLGCAPEQIVADGNYYRFPTGKKGNDDAGWYRFSDDDFPRGSFGDWRAGAKHKWAARDARELTPADERRLQELEVARVEQVQAARERAAENARQLWSNAQAAQADHPYLAAKGVGSHDLRQSGDQLLVPLTTDGETIVSMQSIDADGNKRFLAGGH